jgi:hypothetical protein
MGIRDQLRRLKHEMRGNMDFFILEDGTRYYFDPTSTDLILHVFDCCHAQAEGVPFPEPPEIIKAIARAKDRRSALQQAVGSGTFGLFPYETEDLIQQGRITPRSLVEGRELGDGPVPDLSEQAKDA